MFAATRTPPKKVTATKTAAPPAKVEPARSKVRTSIGEWESGRLSPSPSVSPSAIMAALAGPSRHEPASAAVPSKKDTTVKASVGAPGSPPPKPVYGSKLAEAKACLTKAKTALGLSRNLKGEYKESIVQAIDRLYQLVKELESGLTGKSGSKKGTVGRTEESYTPSLPPPPPPAYEDISRKLDEHKQLIIENSLAMAELKEKMCAHQALLEMPTYASVVAGSDERKLPQRMALRSAVVTSNDETDSGEKVLEQFRKAVNAREGGIAIDRVRKAKDRKVIVGCRDQAELEKVKKRVKENNKALQIEELKNKDPLIVLYDVLQSNSDEEVVRAIRVQNADILRDIGKEEDRIEVKYRRKARNPLTAHVVLQASPSIWRALTQAEAVRIDIQRVRVADQSPVIQCSRCLGYGHGRRFCDRVADVCSHCGGQHLKAKCPEWLSGLTPTCVNCQKTSQPRVDHNAFSDLCPVRKKWDLLARSSVSYC